MWNKIFSLIDIEIEKFTLEDYYLRYQFFLKKEFGANFYIFCLNKNKTLFSDEFITNNNYFIYFQQVVETGNSLNFRNQLGENLFFIPLYYQEALKYILVFSRLDQQFSETELIYFKTIAKLFSYGHQKLLHEDNNNLIRKQLNLVQKVTSQLVNISDLETLTQEIADLILNTFNYYYVAVFTIAENKKSLLFRASARSKKANQPTFEYNQGDSIKLGEHIVGHVAQTGELLIANDVSKEPKYGHLDTLSLTKSEITLPLLIDNDVIGVLDVQANNLNSFSEQDVAVLQTLANNIAIAIHRVNLFDISNRRYHQLEIVGEVSQALTVILDLDELLKVVAETIQERFGFPFIHVFLTEPQKNRITFMTGAGERANYYKAKEVSYEIGQDEGIIGAVAYDGKIRCIKNLQNSPLYVPPPDFSLSNGSELAIPLVFGNQILGVLDIQSNKRNAFTQDDQTLFSILASHITTAIRNAKLYRSEIWRRNTAEALRDLSIQMTKNTSLSTILELTLKKLSEILNCEAAFILLYKTPKDAPFEDLTQGLSISYKNISSIFENIDLSTNEFDVNSWFFSSITSDKPVIRNNSDPIDILAKTLNFNTKYSSISAPLKSGNTILGFLILHHHDEGRFGSESQNITASFSGFTAIAIENFQLFQISQEQAWISTILLQVAQSIQALSTIPELVSTVVRLTPLLVGVEGCGLFLRESESNNFVLHEIYGNIFEGSALEKPLLIFGGSTFDQLIQSYSPILINDPKNELGLPDEIIDRIFNKTVVLLPLISRNLLLGAFLLVQTDPIIIEKDSNIVNDRRLAIIQGIAQQTAVAIENIRLLEAKQEEAYVSAVLLQISQIIVGNQELASSIDSILQLISILVGIDCSIIYFWNEHEEVFQTTHVNCSTFSNDNLIELIKNRYAFEEFPILDSVKQTSKPIVHPTEIILSPDDWDLALPNEIIMDYSVLLNEKSGVLMGFPLSFKDDFYGVLVTQEEVYRHGRERRFEILTGIAQQISLAIQNERLIKERADREKLDQEFNLAREIQRTFLPEFLPIIEGFETDVRWYTARQVGGDFYDLFKISKNKYGILIADVSDKGLAASLYMTVTRTLIRATALELLSTSETLQKVNELLLIDSQKGFFVTTFYAILDNLTGDLKYTNAGHNPPYLLRSKNNQIVELRHNGIAIGAIKNISLPEGQTKIDIGDTLVLHTDGVSEAFNSENEIYGDERYRQVLNRGINVPVKNLLDLIEKDISTFRGTHPLSDDTTLLAIRRIPSLAN